VVSYLERQAFEGPFVPSILSEELQIEATLRRKAARAIGAEPADISICGNTTDGLNLVAAGVEWRAGDEVVSCDQEHASGLIPWFVLRDRVGIRVRVAQLPASGRGVAEAIEAECSPRTRLICLSHASWCTGLSLPIKEIVSAAHRRGIAVLVDGAQGPGHLAVDVRDLEVDFYALSSQKWLMGPHGAGALYVSPSALWRPFPSRLGWASASRVSPDGSYDLFKDGRQYEFATTNHAVLSGFITALDLYLENGPQRVWKTIRARSDALVDRLRSLPGIEIVSPREEDLASGLVVFRLAGVAPKAVVDRLWETRRISCRQVDPAAVRMSTHIFNTEAEFDIVLQGLQDLA